MMMDEASKRKAQPQQIAQTAMDNGHVPTFLTALCELLMCSDPWPASQRSEDDVKHGVNVMASKLGFSDWVEAYHGLCHTGRAARAAVPVVQPPRKLWLWKNFVDGRPEYWAFDNPYPTNLDDGDPQTLGQPCGYAIFKPSLDGSCGRTEDQVLLEMASVASRSAPLARQEPKPDAVYPVQPSSEAATARDAARYLDALVWALGAHDTDGFRERSANEGPYWWRKELAERAGLRWNGEMFVSSTPAQGDGGTGDLSAVDRITDANRHGEAWPDGAAAQPSDSEALRTIGAAGPLGDPEVMEPFWCHEQSHDRARCESQCAECAEVAPSQAPIGLAQQLAAAAEAIEAGHDPLCMSVLRGKACTCGALGTGSAAGRTTAEFSSLRTQAHGYGVPASSEPEPKGGA